MILGAHSHLQHAISSLGAAVGQMSRAQGDMRHLRQINPCPGTLGQASVFGLPYFSMSLHHRKKGRWYKMSYRSGTKPGTLLFSWAGSDGTFPGCQSPAVGLFYLVVNKGKFLRNCNVQRRNLKPFPLPSNLVCDFAKYLRTLPLLPFPLSLRCSGSLFSSLSLSPCLPLHLVLPPCFPCASVSVSRLGNI